MVLALRRDSIRAKGHNMAGIQEGPEVTDNQGTTAESPAPALPGGQPTQTLVVTSGASDEELTQTLVIVGTDDRRDATRLPMALVSLALLLVGLIGWAAGSSPAKGAGFTLFALIGFGSACTIAIRRRRWPALAFSAPLGFTIVLLVGFVLVEARIWAAGVPLFVIGVAVAASLNTWEVAKAIPRLASLHSFTAGGARTNTSPTSAHASPPATYERAALDSGIPRSETVRRRMVAAASALSGVGLLLCIWGAFLIKNFVPHGPGATLAALPPIWYLGIALVIGAVVVALVASGWVAGLAVATLQVAVTITPAIVYNLPRYSWTFKHLGVVEYVLRHGAVNPTLDIYQAWPAFFAGAAWVCHAVGISNPTVLARWWPPVTDVAIVFAMQHLAFRALGSVRRSWLAAAIVVVGNMIGQDYFSPQAAGFFLAVAVFAAVYKRRHERRGMGVSDWILVGAMVIAVAVTHQLSPYMIVGASVVLALFGLCRSRIVPVVALVSAGGWALLHFSVVKRYFNFNQFGDVATNALTKGFVAPGIHKSALIHYDSYAMALDAGLIGVMALLVLAQRRDKVHIALALCAASGTGLFLANSYGNEGAFRVVLFSLPWLAILCSDWNAATAPRLYWAPVVALPILLGSYLVADWGLDFMNVVRPNDLQVEQAFESKAPAGSRLYILGSYFPAKSTSRYYLFKYRSYPYIVTGSASKKKPSHLDRNIAGSQAVKFSAAESFDIFMQDAIPQRSTGLRKHRYFVVTGSAPEAASEELDHVKPAQYRALQSEFLRSKDWRLVSMSGHSVLLELTSFFYDARRPTVSGLDQDGQVLTLDRGIWQTLNPLHFSYQWEMCSSAPSHCTAIPGATHRRFRLRAAEVGHRLVVAVRVTDSKGNSKVVSASTYPIGKPFTPANVVAPSIVGSASKFGVLTVHVGKWQSPDKLRYKYQWEECATSTSTCTPLPRKTRAHLRMRYALEGHYISAIITATDEEGQSTQATAARVGPVVP